MGLSAEEIESVYKRRYAGFRLGAGAILNDLDAAHDVVQESFARALVEREKCHSNSPEAWIWRIIERKAFDERRRRRRVGRLEDTFDSLHIPTEANPAVAAAVMALAPRRRLVVFLRYFADLGYADIARVCGMSEGTVAATLAQAHSDLLQRLEVERTPG
jgi:RNA polymerase sigma-70 factor (ECF subfamily)